LKNKDGGVKNTRAERQSLTYAKLPIMPRRALHKSSNCHCEGVPSSLTLIRTGSDDRSNLISLIALGRDCFAELAMTRCDSYAKRSMPRGGKRVAPNHARQIYKNIPPSDFIERSPVIGNKLKDWSRARW
jgi:hypothetical protein